MPHFSSLGEIARRFGVPLHRIQYVVRTRSISARQCVGGRNLYSPADSELIADALSEVALKKALGDTQGNSHTPVQGVLAKDLQIAKFTQPEVNEQTSIDRGGLR